MKFNVPGQPIVGCFTTAGACIVHQCELCFEASKIIRLQLWSSDLDSEAFQRRSNFEELEQLLRRVLAHHRAAIGARCDIALRFKASNRLTHWLAAHTDRYRNILGSHPRTRLELSESYAP